MRTSMETLQSKSIVDLGLQDSASSEGTPNPSSTAPTTPSTGLEETSENDIAIVGMACRLPGDVTSPSTLWDLLESKRTGQCKIPKQRFNVDGWYHPNGDRPGSINTKGGYFLNEDVRQFENGFFGMNNLEATYLDPQQRKLLEVTFECLESAGLSLADVSGANIGTYIGNFVMDFICMQTRDPEYLARYSATGLGTTLLSNRISHIFDLRGPSLVVDTACSSSLYSLHLAVSALRRGECNGALVGGANLITSPEQHLLTMKAGVLSATSACHTFDSSADGYGRGEGVGVLYLKRLTDAIRDGDTIRAVVRGTAINANGKTPGITQPSSMGQEDVIRKAYADAGNLNFSNTTYVECHGTGTPVGDPIEVTAVSNVFSSFKSAENPLMIGSIKTNLGHSEAASGISSVIKVVLGLERNTIPPTYGVKNINPNLKLEERKMKVITDTIAWPSAKGIKRAGVNSFGYGGANSHAILESVDSCIPWYNDYLKRTTRPSGSYGRRTFLIPVSASNETSLKARLEGIKSLSEDLDIIDLAYTLGCRRSHLPVKGFLTTTQTGLNEDLTEANLIWTSKRRTELPLTWIFTGQGAQWPQMGKELMEEFPAFLACIRELDAVLSSLDHAPGWTLEQELMEPKDTSRINDVTRSQPVCTAIQIGIIRILKGGGLMPKIVTGHSSGEIAAAYAANRLTAEQAITAAFYRGYVVGQSKLKGAMLAAGMGYETASKYIESTGLVGKIVIGCINSPESVTFSGDDVAIDALLEKLESEKKFARKLATGGRAYHSHQMAAIADQYQSLLDQAFNKLCGGETMLANTAQEEGVTWISSVNNMPVTKFPSAEYWTSNLVSPVRFSDALQTILKTDKSHIIEIGPHSALELPVKQVRTALKLTLEEVPYTTALTRGKHAVACVLKLFGQLFLHGHKVEFQKVNWIEAATVNFGKQRQGRVIPNLPPYKWNYGDLLWNESRQAQEIRDREFQRHDLLGSKIPGNSDVEFVWRNVMKISDVPWLEDHKLNSTIVLPGAAYLAMAMEAASQFARIPLHAGDHRFHFRQVAIHTALDLTVRPNGTEVFTRVWAERLTAVAKSSRWLEFEISSHSEGSATTHCSGKVRLSVTAVADLAVPTLDAVDTTNFEASSGKVWFDEFDKKGLNYGPEFRTITQVMSSPDKKLPMVTAKGPLVQSIRTNGYPGSFSSIHPVTIDAAIQLAIISKSAGVISKLECQVPTFIDQCTIQIPSVADVSSEFIFKSESSVSSFGSSNANVSITDTSGNVFMNMVGLRMATISPVTGKESLAGRHPNLRVVWRPDITRMNDTQLIDYITNFGAAAEFPCESKSLRDICSVVELVAHKNPRLNILELGVGCSGKSKYLFESLSATTAFKRFRSYSLGRFSEDGKIFSQKVTDPLDLPTLKDMNGEFDGQFDLVIVSDKSVATAMAIHQWITLGDALSSGAMIVAVADMSMATAPPESFISMSGVVGNSFIIGKRSDPNGASEIDALFIESPSQAATALSSVLRSKMALSTVTLDKCTPELIQKQSKIIMALELEKPFLASMSDEENRQLKVVTDNASYITWLTGHNPLTGLAPELSLISGLARALQMEQPSLKITTLHIGDSSKDIEISGSSILSTMMSTNSPAIPDDSEFVIHEGKVLVSRFTPDETLNQRFREAIGSAIVPRKLKDISPAQLGMSTPGAVDSIHFRQAGIALEAIADDYVDVKVRAVGLNAKDVYTLAGRVDTREGTCSLEYTGTIRRTGSKVTNLKIGDKVVVMAPGFFKTNEIVPYWACQKLEDSDDLELLATMPIAYATAILALNKKANLRKGQTVLIHSGAGAVGIAAITIAQLVGAEIYTTVGNAGKADFLFEKFSIPRNRIFNSRDADCITKIIEATSGKGIDVVLNSLIGDMLHESWRCCSEFGTFVEIGKRDILDAGKLDMNIFLKNVTFTAFDLTNLYYSESLRAQELWSSLLGEVVQLYREGKIGPIDPCEIFDAGDFLKAFRRFSAADRKGKLVISFKPDSIVPSIPSMHRTKFSPEKTYLMIGCLGGLGGSMSKYMVERGARSFVFLGRSGTDKAPARKLVTGLERAGIDVKVVRGDVQNEADVQECIRISDKPIGGVIQAAMGLSEALFTSMSNKSWHTGIQPKFKGTWNLHNALLGKDDQLDFFLFTSSVSGSVGTATESNYCSANGFLDAFARYRHSLGKPATAVGLGMIAEVGYLHDNPEIEALLLRKGIQAIPEAEMIQLIDNALTNESVRSKDDPLSYSHTLTGLEAFGFQKLRKQGFEITNLTFNDTRASILADSFENGGESSESGKVKSDDVVDFRSATGDALFTAVSTLVSKRFSSLVLIPLPQIDVAKPLVEYGMDSMIAAEFRTWFYQTFEFEIPFLMLLSKTKSLTDICKTVQEHLEKIVKK